MNWGNLKSPGKLSSGFCDPIMVVGLIRIDYRRLSVEKIEAQVLWVENCIPELLEIFENLAIENNVESNRGEKELDILRVGHDKNITAGFLNLFHIVDERADAAAAEKSHLVEIEYNVRASHLHHFMDLGVQDTGIVPTDFALYDE